MDRQRWRHIRFLCRPVHFGRSNYIFHLHLIDLNQFSHFEIFICFISPRRYMPPIGISVGTSTLIGNALGGGRAREAERLAYIGLALEAIYAAINCGIYIFGCRYSWPKVFRSVFLLSSSCLCMPHNSVFCPFFSSDSIPAVQFITLVHYFCFHLSAKSLRSTHCSATCSRSCTFTASLTRSNACAWAF